MIKYYRIVVNYRHICRTIFAWFNNYAFWWWAIDILKAVTTAYRQTTLVIPNIRFRVILYSKPAYGRLLFAVNAPHRSSTTYLSILKQCHRVSSYLVYSYRFFIVKLYKHDYSTAWLKTNVMVICKLMAATWAGDSCRTVLISNTNISSNVSLDYFPREAVRSFH